MNSIILSDKITSLMALCEFPLNQQWQLIYRASQDGFEASHFHKKCDNKPNTLVVIKSTEGNVFGGYTEQSWSSPSKIELTRIDTNAFIFSFINKKNTPIKFKCSQNKVAIYCCHSFGPSFGGTAGKKDLLIQDK